MYESAGAGSGEADRTAGAAIPASALPFPALRIDADGRVAASNGALERELGVEAGSLAGRPLADLLAQSGREGASTALRSAADAVRAAREAPALRLSFTSAAGSARSRTFSVAPAADGMWLLAQPLECDERREALERAQRLAEAEAVEFARVSQELRAANEQLELRSQALRDATEAKARFLATMSHELRTPLNAVLGYAGLLRDGVYGAVGEQQQRAVHAIVRRAKDLQLLIDDVLDLSKIEAGRAELRVDEFDPATVLSEVKDTIIGFAREKELMITVRTSNRGPVRLDRAKYRQIVLNLAANAVKFTPRRGEVALSVEHERDGTFVTRVRDTGIGIAAADVHRIFDNFQQVDTGTTRRYEGLGLGLAIVRRIVELLGGTIEVESTPGRGTTFIVRLPERPEPEAVLGEPGEIPADTELGGDPIVVAIDDNPEVVALLRDSLAPAHFRVVGALSGDRGMELARILKPLAITLDIMMPEKDGWQVLREIKADPELSRIPVIIMSIVSERSLGFSLGVADYLVKPVDRRVLIDVLERLRRPQALHSALVLDDDYDARALMRDLLVSLGFTVRVAETADEAIAALNETPPEVLFVDIAMRGDEVTHVLDCVAQDPRLEHVRTVIVTRSDARDRHPDWLRRAATSVVYDERERPDELLRQLRAALAAIGANAEAPPAPAG
ncbi:MAG TPA: ATP-binding protein [Gemmatimonadaceae bacterium]|nr:ATP-binding protein [Gemmatimonadaceae bacterium]